jgi:hypothetical protein
MDWKTKANEINDGWDAAREKREKGEREESERKENEKREKENKKKLRTLARKFKCNICRTPSKKPRDYKSHDAWGGGYENSTDWNTPGDLEKCRSCLKWMCKKHIHKRICKTCAEKL